MADRKCFIIKSSTKYNRHICVDANEAEGLLEYLEGSKQSKKFNYIANRILEQKNAYYDDYEVIDGDITCMRFFPNGDNVRIYCKEEILDGQLFCIIMSKMAQKKTNSIGKSIQSKIDSLKTFSYEIEHHEDDDDQEQI